MKNSVPLFFCHSPRLPRQRRGVRLKSNIFVAKQKYLTPEKSGVRYENVFHGSTLLTVHGPSLVSSVTGGPVPAYISVGGSKAVTGFGSNKGRLQPAAAPLCCLSRAASFSMPFYIGTHHITGLYPCQEDKISRII